MAYPDLNAFLCQLEKTGQLVQISARVSPILEITEIVDRISKSPHGKAILFTNVEGSPYPVAINLFGSGKRMAMALNVPDLSQLSAAVEPYLDPSRYDSLGKLMRFLPELLRLAGSFPQKVRYGLIPCQERVEKEPDLSLLPILQCWPKDGGRFLTLPLVITKPLNSPTQNYGMYRMQVLDPHTAVLHWHMHKDGAVYFEQYRQKNRKMPVAVALGCGPAVTYAATSPLPPGLNELLLAGFLQKRPVRLVKCRTCPLWVPWDAQIILEGYVNPAEELALEGPFGDHTGYYSGVDYYPRFHVTCMTHRKNPIYQATVVGRPPMEDAYLGKVTEQLFLPFLKLAIPELEDLYLPVEGGFHNCAVVAVKKKYPGAARTVMNALWGLGQMRYMKLIIAVPEGTTIRNRKNVMDAILRNVRAKRDLIFSRGPLDALDHASDTPFFGTRLGVDATNPGTQAPGRWVVVRVKKRRPGDGLRLAQTLLERDGFRLAVAVDETVNTDDVSEVLWRVFSNIDAERDLRIWDNGVTLDATTKLPGEIRRPWPDDIVMSEEIKERVDRRWQEYGLEGLI